MDISKYPITYPYGATSPPYSKTYPHLGADRKCDVGTPLIVNGLLIGRTGNTGKSSGPHHHLQKVQNGRVVNPGKGGFTIPAPAVVYSVGEQAKVGKFIRIRDAQGVEWSHFHLSEILVKKGQKIGAAMDLYTSPPVFNPKYYLAKHDDVRKHKNTEDFARQHWLEYGIKEGRESAPNFHVREYLANYADLRRTFGSKGYKKAIEHYFEYGINEGRSGRTVKAAPKPPKPKKLSKGIYEVA